MTSGWRMAVMKKSTDIPNQINDGKVIPAKQVKNEEVSLHEQVRREFAKSEDHGEPESEQLKNELNEPDYTLPSPMISLEDAAFANINPDQIGEAFGLDVERNEPLDPVEEIEERDENRWELNQKSAKEIKS